LQPLLAQRRAVLTFRAPTHTQSLTRGPALTRAIGPVDSADLAALCGELRMTPSRTFHNVVAPTCSASARSMSPVRLTSANRIP
jgi:hypothetical protein